MLSDKRASAIPQFGVVIAFIFVLGAAAAWAIRTDFGGPGTNVVNWINSMTVPTAHP